MSKDSKILERTLPNDPETAQNEENADFDEVGNDTEKTGENLPQNRVEFPTESEKTHEVVEESINDAVEEAANDEAEEAAEEAPIEATVDGEEPASKSPTEGENDPNSELLKALTDEIKALRAELDNVRAESSERAAQYERMNAEYAEFSSLFPDVTLNAVPQSVWNEVGRGVPLAAAYALESRRAAIERQRADAVNEKNSAASLGSLENRAETGFYSPSEVRAMSRSEVRANYSKILESMKHWH